VFRNKDKGASDVLERCLLYICTRIYIYMYISRILAIEQSFVGQGCSLERFKIRILNGAKLKI
jgi:hypothetical protein